MNAVLRSHGEPDANISGECGPPILITRNCLNFPDAAERQKRKGHNDRPILTGAGTARAGDAAEPVEAPAAEEDGDGADPPA